MGWTVNDFQACSPKITPLSVFPASAACPRTLSRLLLLCALAVLQACLCLSFQFPLAFFIPASIVCPLDCWKSLRMGLLVFCL